MIHNVNFEELRNYCDTLGNMGGYDAYAYSRDMVKEFTEFPELINVEKPRSIVLTLPPIPSVLVLQQSPLIRMTYNPERLLDEGEEPVAY